MDAGAQGQPTVIVGRLNVTEKDLEGPLVQMSFLFRMRTVYTVFVAVAVAYLLATSNVQLTRDLALQLVFVVTFVGFLYLGPRVVARRLRRSLIRGGDDELIYRFDDEGVTIRSAGSTTTFAYRTLVKVREARTAFLLYCSPFVANIVPKRAFEPGDLDRLRSLMSVHTPPKPFRLLPGKVFLIWVSLIFFFLVIWQLVGPGPR